MARLNKKWAALAIVLIMVVMTACGNSASPSNTSNSGNSKNSGTENTGKGNEAAPKAAPLKISYMAPLHSTETPDPKIEKLIEEKLNVDLEIQWIPATTYTDRLNAAFATGNLPHVASVSVDGANREAIRDGQYWEIGPYLDQFENLGKLKDEILNNMKIDGKIYSLYQGRPLSRQGIIYRQDWLDNLGLPTPSTTDELYEMLKQFTENDPDQNGKKDTIGLADRGDLAYGAFKTIASWFGAPNEWGLQDGQLMPAFTFPEYAMAMDFMKSLRDNGYINLDFPVTSKVDQQNMTKNGTAGAYIGCMCDVQPLYTDAVQLNPDIVFDVHNQIKGPSGEFTVWAIAGYNHPYMFPKSAVETEEQLLQILAFMDQMMSPEISNLLFWGVEGEHYNIVDGVAVQVDDQAKIDREVTPYRTIEVGEADTNGRLGGESNYLPMKKAGELFIDNDKYVVSDPTITLDSQTFTLEKDRLTQIINDATYNYMLGGIDLDGFQKQIERWKSEGGDKVIEEFNASYQQANH